MRIVGLKERTELVRPHDVDRQNISFASTRVSLDSPAGVPEAARLWMVDVMFHRFERNDEFIVQHTILEKIPILSSGRADVQDAVDPRLCDQLVKVLSKVALLGLAPGNRVATQGPGDLQRGILDDLEYDSLLNLVASSGGGRIWSQPRLTGSVPSADCRFTRANDFTS